jgi:hypothetical protein
MDLHPDQLGTAAAAGEPMGPIRFLTCHWTAGHPHQTFGDYHGCITGDGKYHATLPLAVKGAHTWGRNGGNIGLALCALGPGKVQRIQLETLAKAIAEHAHAHGLDLAGKVEMPRRRVVGEQLLPAPGIVMVPVLTDHAFWAKADGYYPERWDIGELMVSVRAKAGWYLKALEEGRTAYEHTRR